ncbi:MAG: 50S ribosomal protein L20 [Candidatus Subteraquimicrobiales bacterium]|nr:50S ribosomal protein L20 [Candidatus Subteraquimicrobiales bacterium]
MSRVKKGTSVKRRHKKVLKLARGYYGRKSKTFKAAKEQVMHSLAYSYRDRKAKKGEFRRLWITRINAAARLNGLNYSHLISGLKLANVDIDRKMLSDMAVNDPEAFSKLALLAKEKIGA